MDGADRIESDERLVWTVAEAGRMLGISRAHAYELVARGELPHLRRGRRVVVPKQAIEVLLAVASALGVGRDAASNALALLLDGNLSCWSGRAEPADISPRRAT